MRKLLEVIKKKCKWFNSPKRIGMLLGTAAGTIIILRMLIIISINTISLIEQIWFDNRKYIFGILPFLIYVYPIMYSFFIEVKSKDKEIRKIIKKDDVEEIKQELMMFDYYTLPRFIAHISKQFSAIWLFIFIQVLFPEVPELSTENSRVMLQVYYGVLKLTLLISFAFFVYCVTFSDAIIIVSLNKNKRAEKIVKNYVDLNSKRL